MTPAVSFVTVFLVLIGLSQARAAAPQISDSQLEEIFEPMVSAPAALSPDGKWVAYARRGQGFVSLFVASADIPGAQPNRIFSLADAQTEPIDPNGDPTPWADILEIDWVSPQRLVIETNQSSIRTAAGGGNPPVPPVQNPDPRNKHLAQGSAKILHGVGYIMALNRDGSRVRRLTDAFEIAQELPLPARPVIFDPAGPKPGTILARAVGLFETVYSIDAETGHISAQADCPAFVRQSQVAVVDRAGRGRLRYPDSWGALSEHFPESMGYWTERGGSRDWVKLERATQASPQTQFEVTPENYLATRAIPIGFDRDPAQLFFASNLGRDTAALHRLDLRPGGADEVVFESDSFDLVSPDPERFLFPSSDATTIRIWQKARDRDWLQVATGPEFRNRSGPLVFDRYTRELVGFRYNAYYRTAHWFSGDFQPLQELLENTFPERSVDILDWSADRSRYLVRVSGPTNRGAYYVFTAGSHRAIAIFNYGTAAERQMQTLLVQSSSQPSLSGILTLPKVAKTTLKPLIVLCPARPWERTAESYQPDRMALAEMGFAVLQINAQGVYGFGRKQAALDGSSFEVVQSKEILKLIEQVRAEYPVSGSYVGLFGRGLGSYLALRALQLNPNRFRCAVGMDAVVDLKSWLAHFPWDGTAAVSAFMKPYLGSKADLDRSPLLSQSQEVKSPVFLTAYHGYEEGSGSHAYAEAHRLASRCEATDQISACSEESETYVARRPVTEAASFRRAEKFLDETMFDYDVHTGQAVPVKN